MTHLLVKAWLQLAATCWSTRLCTLVYHRVLVEPDPMYPHDVTIGEFDAQMSWIAKTFNVLPMHEAIELLSTHALPPRTLCITFDDGYQNSRTHALPVLQKHGLPATVFICTTCLDNKVMWNDRITEGVRAAKPQRLNLERFGLGSYDIRDGNRAEIARRLITDAKYRDFRERDELATFLFTLADGTITDPMLTSDDIRALHMNGIEIGCHTRSHPILSRVDDDFAYDEIVESKQCLEGVIEAPVRFFAYPNGHPKTDFRSEHVEMVRKAGFVAAFTADSGGATSDDDLFQLPRFAPWDKTEAKYLIHLALSYFQPPVLTPGSN